MPVANHPARFSAVIVDALKLLMDDVEATDFVLDPFAGTGLVHELPGSTVGIEIEQDWAKLSPGTLVGDATALPFRDDCFDVIVTSPTYGNRMADHHDAKDGSKRNTYRHSIGHPLKANNTGQMQWGPLYQRMHAYAYAECRRVLKLDCPFVLNVSDHIRSGRRIEVTRWHRQTLEVLGFELVDVNEISTPRNGFGANGNVRVEFESILIFNNGKGVIPPAQALYIPTGDN